MRARFKCAESVSWLSRCHKDIVDVLVVAGIHREDGDVCAVFKQVLVEVCSEEIEDTMVMVIDGGDKIALVRCGIFNDGFIKA